MKYILSVVALNGYLPSEAAPTEVLNVQDAGFLFPIGIIVLVIYLLARARRVSFRYKDRQREVTVETNRED